MHVAIDPQKAPASQLFGSASLTEQLVTCCTTATGYVLDKTGDDRFIQDNVADGSKTDIASCLKEGSFTGSVERSAIGWSGWKADISRADGILDHSWSTTRINGPASRLRMSIEESGRKRRERESAERRSERLEQGADDRNADRKADDANVQRMIERSIKDHGA
jgi:hypothetical protein